jgi:hypothetical protein
MGGTRKEMHKHFSQGTLRKETTGQGLMGAGIANTEIKLGIS